MEPVSKSSVQIVDWPGLMTNTGPLPPMDAPGAAVEQINLQCNTPGEMTTRPGFRRVLFDGD